MDVGNLSRMAIAPGLTGPEFLPPLPGLGTQLQVLLRGLEFREAVPAGQFDQPFDEAGLPFAEGRAVPLDPSPDGCPRSLLRVGSAVGLLQRLLQPVPGLRPQFELETVALEDQDEPEQLH